MQDKKHAKKEEDPPLLQRGVLGKGKQQGKKKRRVHYDMNKDEKGTDVWVERKWKKDRKAGEGTLNTLGQHKV